MIEAVNSVLATAPLVRGNADQQASTRQNTAPVERVQEVARAPFVSPFIFVDTNFDRAVLQIRDSDTGDVVRQFPSESQLEAFRRAEAARLQQETSQSRDVQATEAPRTQNDNVPETRVEPAQAVQNTPTTNNGGGEGVNIEV